MNFVEKAGAVVIEPLKAAYLTLPVIPDVTAVGEAVRETPRYNLWTPDQRKALTAVGGIGFAALRTVAPLTVRAIEFHNELSRAKTSNKNVPEWIHVGAPMVAVAADLGTLIFTVLAWGAGGLPGVVAVAGRRLITKFAEHTVFGIGESLVKNKYTR